MTSANDSLATAPRTFRHFRIRDNLRHTDHDATFVGIRVDNQCARIGWATARIDGRTTRFPAIVMSTREIYVIWGWPEGREFGQLFDGEDWDSIREGRTRHYNLSDDPNPIANNVSADLFSMSCKGRNGYYNE